ncbi:tetratricopeptide repeat protein [Bacteroides sp. ET71]|uniref:tetratricopeptide repeat protein n=1 Tax=Bacteroides sp. ET71 TaxID=2939421 RepID=UPI0020138DF6|nr:tetratricopeptide repeat protein [Bacteroides sp. ET71]MCL1617553.1 tetratricopeptide repeat protein [Bacteroides sp. ET71]
MTHDRYIWLTLLLFTSMSAFAQKAERDYIRKGNRCFKDSIYVDAEINYRKALDVNPQSTIAMFNLGNTLLWQNKQQEAMEQFVSAAQIEKDKDKKGKIFHNIGVIFHSQKEYAKAIEAYKESLRNNPKDDETRYNLALAQKMLKDQQQNQKEEQNQSQQQQQQQNSDQNQKEQENQKQNQQQQSKAEEKENQMSRENAEQLLRSVMQDEENTQDKVKKQQIIQGGRLEKDW